MFWTRVKDNIVKEKQDYEAIELRGFDYKILEEEEVEEVREGLDKCPYLKNLTQLF